jgi:hypothetical protein
LAGELAQIGSPDIPFEAADDVCSVVVSVVLVAGGFFLKKNK